MSQIFDEMIDLEVFLKQFNMLGLVQFEHYEKAKVGLFKDITKLCNHITTKFIKMLDRYNIDTRKSSVHLSWSKINDGKINLMLGCDTMDYNTMAYNSVEFCIINFTDEDCKHIEAYFKREVKKREETYHSLSCERE